MMAKLRVSYTYSYALLYLPGNRMQPINGSFGGLDA